MTAAEPLDDPETRPAAAPTVAAVESGNLDDDQSADLASDEAKGLATLAALGLAATATDLLHAIVAERPNGEVRPQQQHMVELVEKAIADETHLLVQAGTGTGKSLGYLIPAIASGKRVIVSTATKQLGEQIITEDMPTLATLIPKVGGDAFTYALIKGRANYVCRREVDSLLRLDDEAPDAAIQDALFDDLEPREAVRRPTSDDLKKLNSLLKWVDDTDTGDRSDAPAVPDRVWDQVSTDAAGCAGRSCPFQDTCFAEHARAYARNADVVVTNHAQVAQDLKHDSVVLGEWQVLVADEVHELESYLSTAWGLEVAPASMRHHAAQALRKMSRGDTYQQARETGKKVLEDLDALGDMLSDVQPGLCPELPNNVGALLVEIARKLRTLMDAFEQCAEERGVGQVTAAERKGAGQKIGEMCNAVVTMCADMSDGTKVRWLESGHGSRGPALKVAPLWIGPELMRLLDKRTLIATSATMTVGGSFDPFIRTLALRETVEFENGTSRDPREFTAVDVGTPFNYDQQAMLYIPDDTFPAPVGQEREAHTAAVKEEVLSLAKAAGGRTLALFTTRRGAEAAAAHLRAHLDTPVLCQGDAPPSHLIADFKDDEHATLCATMGFWHGVNAPGATCNLVVLDKIPFAPMHDPLMSARRKAVDDAGRRGFDEVYVAGASVMLAQGVGRLIRTATDKGVVAVLDNRLTTKYYGATMISSMPRMRVFRDRAVVENALTRLADAADAALEDAGKTGPKGPAATTTKKSATSTNIPVRKAAPRRANTRSLAKKVRKNP